MFGNKIVADFVSNWYLFRNEIKIKKNNLTPRKHGWKYKEMVTSPGKGCSE